jgi:hypothetical protein
MNRQFPAPCVSVRVSQPEQQQLAGFFVTKTKPFGEFVSSFSVEGRNFKSVDSVLKNSSSLSVHPILTYLVSF